jgi:hypothetical protein
MIIKLIRIKHKNVKAILNITLTNKIQIKIFPYNRIF